MSVIVFSKPKPRITDNPKWTEKPGNRAGINKRVEMLGKLDDRYKLARGAGDREALRKLADEYEKLGNHGGCPNKASQILMEVEGLHEPAL